MTRYVIHIGPYKTGTTYLQHAFTAMRPALLSRGMCYPENWGSIHGHHVLTEQLQRNEKTSLRDAFGTLAAAGLDTILLSSETFSSLTDGQVAGLREALGAHPATIVFYFRRWSELLPSMWRETLKGGGQETLQGYVAQCLSAPTDSEIVNAALVLDRYGKCFGARNIRVASYSSVVEGGEDLLVHFCRNFLDWPDPPSNTLGRVNASLDLVDCEVLRTLNAMEWIRSGASSTRIYNRYMALKPALPIAAVVEGAMQYTVNPLRLDDATSGLAQLHDRIARQYRKALVPPAPGGRLFEPRVTETLFVHPDFVLRPGILDFMHDIHRRLLAAEHIL